MADIDVAFDMFCKVHNKLEDIFGSDGRRSVSHFVRPEVHRVWVAIADVAKKRPAIMRNLSDDDAAFLLFQDVHALAQSGVPTTQEEFDWLDVRKRAWVEIRRVVDRLVP